MSCLLPHFPCPTEAISNSPLLKSHHHPPIHLLPKNRRLILFRAECALSTTSPPASTSSAALLDMEKLQLLSLEARSSSVTSQRSWSYPETIGATKEANFQKTLDRETLLASEEAVLAAAAAEAVALARAAVKVARDAALMFHNDRFQKSESKSATLSSEPDSTRFESAQLRSAAQDDMVGKSVASKSPLEEDCTLFNSSESTREKIELLQRQLSDNIAARSMRQSERKAKRARASEKTVTNEVPVKFGSTSRKKRVTVQDVDYSDPLRYLRATTTTSRLLTASEEHQFSEGIQDLLKLERLHEELEKRYGEEPTFSQWAAAVGVDQKSLRKRLDYGRLCKDKMIKSNIRLVISIAKNYQGSGMSLQDLVQEGCRGLVKGAEKFDAAKGFKFSTYAHWWIKQSVRKSLSDQSRTIRLPFHMVEAMYKVKEAKKQLFSENGKVPENEEVAEATGLSMKRLATVLMTPKPPRSLDQKIGANMNLKPSEIISDPGAETSEEQLMKQFMKQDLEKVLNTLSSREKEVIRLRFGMEDGRMKTLQEIGESMGVSRERIRQIESSAFRKLRNKKRLKPLQQYLVS